MISTITAFADDTSCRVYGTDDVVATITNPVVKCGSSVEAGSGNHFVDVNVELNHKTTKETSVVVNVSDGNRTIGSGVVTITPGYTNGSTWVASNLMKENDIYYISIARASCQ